MTESIKTPVLIIGAGPIGLALALDFGRRGMPCMLVEQTDGSIEQPKIGIIAVRTMEFFRRWGIVDRVRNAGFPNDYELSISFCTSLSGWLLAHEPYPSVNRAPTPSWTPERRQRCPQNLLDPVLQRAVGEQESVSLKFRTRLEKFELFPDYVLATLRDLVTNEVFEVCANYMVACDGAASETRDALGIKMEGKSTLSYSVNILARINDLLTLVKKQEAERYILVGREGTWGNLTVVDGKDLWRLSIIGGSEKIDRSTFDADLWIKRALGNDLPFEVLSVLPWRRSELVAQKYRHERVLLAGDSAHTMSPTGGMGMNTGMGDVFDLGWKLEAVLRGWAPSVLLDSFEMERRPVAIRNGAASTNNFKVWNPKQDCSKIAEASLAGEKLRTEVGKALKEATRIDWESWGLQVGYRYEGSPIIVPDGTPPTPDDHHTYVPTARPGSRAPHAWIAQDKSTLDLFGNGFTLLTFPGAHPNSITALKMAANSANVPLSIDPIRDKSIAELYESSMVLVRPDGHVAWRGDGDVEAEEIIKTVRGM